jgi:hypothetical protein
VNNDAVSELNLLGNAGTQRLVGDSYGIILLPESATGADIEEARHLLIDRGSADASPTTVASSYWAGRTDIIDFRNTDFPNATSLSYAWDGCNNMTQIGTLNAPVATNFNSAFKGTSSLTSFPAGAKLGTSASNVNFTSAWQSSGLTSFPSNIDLSKGGQFLDTWRGTNLTSFSTPITGVDAKRMRRAWYSCTALTDFSYNVFSNWNPSAISTQCFDSTWVGCTSLTALSVQNILTSIDASNQHGTDDGTSTGNPLGDSGIDIHYNVATGSLSAATNTAVDSLKSKGWVIVVNGVTL